MKLTTNSSITPNVKIIWEKLIKDILEYSLQKHAELQGCNQIKFNPLIQDCLVTGMPNFICNT